MKAKVALLCAGLVLFAGSVLAQTPRPQPAPGQAPMAAPRPMHDPMGAALFPPELVMSHQQEIGLTAEQKTYLRQEISRAQARFTELQWQLQDEMETLVSLLKQNAPEETQVMAQLDKVLAAEREIKRAQMGLMVRIKNKLTPEQQARLRELRARMPEPPMPPMPPAPPRPE